MQRPNDEVIVESTTRSSRLISRQVARGALRPVALNLYTPDLETSLEVLVRANWTAVIARLAPGAVISYRTAIEMRPAADGSVFLTGPSRYERNLPGLNIRVVRGPGKLDGDEPFHEGTTIASRARALLDSARPSRRRGIVARGLSGGELEAQLRVDLETGGPGKLSKLREEISDLAGILDARSEANELHAMIGDLLGETTTPLAAVARAHEWLRTSNAQSGEGGKRLFSEAGFEDALASHRLAGGRLTAEEARKLTGEEIVPPGKTRDAAIFSGIHSIVGRRVSMAVGIGDDPTPQDLIERMNAWNRTLLGDDTAGPANATPELARGIEMMRDLEHPMQRAVGVLALLLSFRPYPAGNERLARALMSAELSSAGEPRVLMAGTHAERYREACRIYGRRGDVRPLFDLCISSRANG